MGPCMIDGNEGQMSHGLFQFIQAHGLHLVLCNAGVWTQGFMYVKQCSHILIS